MAAVGRAEQYQQLYDDGLTLQQIADREGISRQRVAQIIGRQNGLRPSPEWEQLRVERQAAVDRILEGSSTVAEEAEKSGVTEAAIRAYSIDRLGIQLPSQLTQSPAHGTVYRYNRGCRCDECKQAIRDAHIRRREAGPKKHGTPSAYSNYGCRCRRCTKAYSVYQREKKQARKIRANVND